MAMTPEQAKLAGQKGGHANRGRRHSAEHVQKRIASARLTMQSKPVLCVECGVEFIRDAPTQKYCSGQCWNRANGRRRMDQQRARKQLSTGEAQRAYAELVACNGNVCQICRVPGRTVVEGPGSGRLHVDHDHATGAIRGLLCASCNRALGYFKDDPGLLKAAIHYLEKERP